MSDLRGQLSSYIGRWGYCMSFEPNQTRHPGVEMTLLRRLRAENGSNLHSSLTRSNFVCSQRWDRWWTSRPANVLHTLHQSATLCEIATVGYTQFVHGSVHIPDLFSSCSYSDSHFLWTVVVNCICAMRWVQQVLQAQSACSHIGSYWLTTLDMCTDVDVVVMHLKWLILTEVHCATSPGPCAAPETCNLSAAVTTKMPVIPCQVATLKYILGWNQLLYQECMPKQWDGSWLENVPHVGQPLANIHWLYSAVVLIHTRDSLTDEAVKMDSMTITHRKLYCKCPATFCDFPIACRGDITGRNSILQISQGGGGVERWG